MRRLTPLLTLLCLTGSTCEPSTTSPPAKGAWAVAFVQPDPTTCHIGGHNVSVGTIDESTYGPVVTDGVDGAVVTCETVDAGNTRFTVRARVEQGGNVLDVDVPEIGAGDDAEAPVRATVRLTDTHTVDELTSSDCYAWFSDGSGQAVQGGRAWFTFSCDGLAGPSDEGCEIAEGYLVVTDCSAS